MRIKIPSLFTILFWGWIGWCWFGDDIKEIAHNNNLKLIVNEEQIDVKDEIQEVVDNATKNLGIIIDKTKDGLKFESLPQEEKEKKELKKEESIYDYDDDKYR